jgi:hypothetical protein
MKVVGIVPLGGAGEVVEVDETKIGKVDGATRCADFVAEVGDYYARGLPRFVDTSSYYAAFGER